MNDSQADKTDDEVREIMDKACREHGGKYLREFAEEVIAMRQRIAELEKLYKEPTNEK